MLTLYTQGGGLPLLCDDYYIKELASGYDELVFSVSIWDDAFPQIQEEGSIKEQSSDGAASYLVKAIDAGKDTATVKCIIDLDAWKADMFLDFKSDSASVAEIVQSVAPFGWAVVDQSGITYKRTIALESATPLSVLDACRSTFPGVTFRFDTEAKSVKIVNMGAGKNMGAYATRDLNLRENNYKGKSTGIITRLYAYGKDGLSFADINGGKPYVENHEYTSRVICGYWKDERYTIAENLLADAQARVDASAIPARSYSCDVVDLAAVSKGKYGFLDFSLFSSVSLIDKTRSGKKIEHKVVERWRYPFLPEKNKVVLSTAPPRIQSQVSQALNNFENPNSVWAQQQRSAQQNAIENATEQLTGAKGGNMRSIYDSSGNWTELVCMNTDSILTASKLWRFNLGGLGYSPNGYNGPYTTAITMDGAIVADFITVGTLDASRVRVENLDAGNITTGTLSADRIGAESITADKIAVGAITADKIDVTDLSALGATIGGWSINSNNLSKETGSAFVGLYAPANPTTTSNAILVQQKVGDTWQNAFRLTYGGRVYANDVIISGNGSVGDLTLTNGTLSGITDTNVTVGGLSGGSGGSIKSASLSTFNMASGINTNLGYGAAYGLATQQDTTVYPTWFKAGYIVTMNGLTCSGPAYLNSTLQVGNYSVSWREATIDGVTIRYLGRA